MNRFIISISLATAFSGAALADGPVEGIPLSGTLPVVYINTENGAPVVNKEDKIKATIYIDPLGDENIPAFGSADEPVEFTLSGRGNSSWIDFDKKPYKIKFDKKQAPFGYPANKTFALLAHAPSQSYIRCETCSEVARLFDIGWVARTHPVEVVLNGVNIGSYAFSETVKIGKGRLDINEQPDNNTDPETIDDGWLIEIDNTDDTPQILLYQNETCEPSEDYAPKRFTVKTPEELSPLQEEWITAQLRDITMEVHRPANDNTWMRHFDMPRLARYYLVQEYTNNFDAFVGSTYFYYTKDDGKWMAGPLWDSEWTFDRERINNFWSDRNFYFPYENHPENLRPVWIDRMFDNPEFRKIALEEWEKFYPAKIPELTEFVTAFYEKINTSYSETNAAVWPQYSGYPMEQAYYEILRDINLYAEWLDNRLRQSLSGIENAIADPAAQQYPLDVYNAAGIFIRRAETPQDLDNLPAGLYIAGKKKILISRK